MSATLQFNASATSAIQGRNGAKLRTEFRDGVLHVRPTDRKAGPHVLTEMQAKGKGKGITIALDDKQVEKLQGGAVMAEDTSFYVVAGKYGWFSIVQGDAPEGNDTKVNLTVTSA